VGSEGGRKNKRKKRSRIKGQKKEWNNGGEIRKRTEKKPSEKGAEIKCSLQRKADRKKSRYIDRKGHGNEKNNG